MVLVLAIVLYILCCPTRVHIPYDPTMSQSAFISLLRMSCKLSAYLHADFCSKFHCVTCKCLTRFCHTCTPHVCFHERIRTRLSYSITAYLGGLYCTTLTLQTQHKSSVHQTSEEPTYTVLTALWTDRICGT